jgi:hypothetical protein
MLELLSRTTRTGRVARHFPGLLLLDRLLLERSRHSKVGGDGVALGIVARHILGEGRAEIIVALGVIGVAGGLELGEARVARGQDRFEARQQAEPAAGDGPAATRVALCLALFRYVPDTT